MKKLKPIISLLILGMLVVFFSFHIRTKEAIFWNWFQANESEIFSMTTGEEPIGDELFTQLHKVNEDLAWEMQMNGVQKDGKKEFTISANGIRTAFPSVEKLIASAPKNLDRWHIVGFRQKSNPATISYGGSERSVNDLYFSYIKNMNKYDITVYVKDYKKETDDGIVFLFLDSWLGEYNTETKLGEIKIQDISNQDPEKLTPFSKLGDIVL